jgi:hypothetical protein
MNRLLEKAMEVFQEHRANGLPTVTAVEYALNTLRAPFDAAENMRVTLRAVCERENKPDNFASALEWDKAVGSADQGAKRP